MVWALGWRQSGAVLTAICRNAQGVTWLDSLVAVYSLQGESDMDDQMTINFAKVKQLRLDRSWSQEHLAEVSGLSLRTIQRRESPTVQHLSTLA
jgi:DNA-binding XRE family transcriptional regulator